MYYSFLIGPILGLALYLVQSFSLKVAALLVQQNFDLISDVRIEFTYMP